jgi:PEP-CTERM motif
MSNVGVNAFGWDFPVGPNGLLFNGTGLTGGASDFNFVLIGPSTPSLSILPLPLSSYQFGQLSMDPFNLDGIGNHFTLAHYVGLLDTLVQTDATDFSFAGHITEYSQIHAVPEPSTWAMLLIGFAAIGFAGYRKSRRENFTACPRTP